MKAGRALRFGEHLVQHGEPVAVAQLPDPLLVVPNQRQQDSQGQRLSFFTAAELHNLK